MNTLATITPVRRPELISWNARPEGHYRVRNRRTGEAFPLGAEEHFLLARLDGRHCAEPRRAAFAHR